MKRADVREFIDFMKKLSSSLRGRTRIVHVFSFLWLLLMLVSMIVIRPIQVWPLAGIGFFVLIQFLHYYAFGRHIVDEVCDAGDALVFRKGDLEQTVKLADIDDIEIESFAVETGVTVHCRHAGVIGSRLIFAARRGGNLALTISGINSMRFLSSKIASSVSWKSSLKKN